MSEEDGAEKEEDHGYQTEKQENTGRRRRNRSSLGLTRGGARAARGEAAVMQLVYEGFMDCQGSRDELMGGEGVDASEASPAKYSR